MGLGIVAVCVGVVLSLTITSCGVGDPNAATTTTAAFTDPASAVVVPDPVRASGCVDGSPSVDADSKDAAIEAFASVASGWPTSPARGPGDSGSAVVGLDLRIRKVMGGTVPTGSAGAEVVHVQIASIPEVEPTPSPGVEGWSRLQSIHKAQRAAADAAVPQATAAATAAGDAIRDADYTATSSEIVGCLEAAARADTAAKLILVSDLNQQDDNGRPVALSGQVSLAGRHILIVEACGARGICGAGTDAWKQMLAEADADVEVVSPEAMAEDLPAFLRSGD
jgi:hypothetical protein